MDGESKHIGAYHVLGNLENALVLPTFDVVALKAEEVFQFLPERATADEGVRPPPAGGLPEWFRFRVLPPEGKARFFTSDALSSPHRTFGVDTFVSAKAREKLESHLLGECEFLPVVMENVQQPYFALWVTRVVDALDRDRAKLTPLTYLPGKGGAAHPLRIDRYAFTPQRTADLHLFRLPGRDLAEQSMNDFATDKFVGLAKELGLSGFQFYSAITEPAFRPR